MESLNHPPHVPQPADVMSSWSANRIQETRSQEMIMIPYLAIFLSLNMIESFSANNDVANAAPRILQSRSQVISHANLPSLSFDTNQICNYVLPYI